MDEQWRRELRKLKDLQPPHDLWRRIAGRELTRVPATRGSHVARPWGVYLTLLIAAAALVLLYRSFFGGGPIGPAPLTHIGATPHNGEIAFASHRDIYVISADGSGLKNISNTPPTDAKGEVVEAPWAWSPGGTKLAYYGYAYDPHSNDFHYDIYVMNADGSGVVNLTGGTSVRSDNSDPQWSPDGTRIAYVALSADGSDLAIYVTEVDASETIRLANGGNPTWSPDGTKIAFEAGGDLYVVNADGSQLSRLTRGPGSSSEPAWSPDGARMAFLSDRDGTPGVYVSSADGKGQTKITETAATGLGPPMWSPDGTRILFQALESGNWDIYVVNADGTGQEDLTPTRDDEDSAVWSPDSTKIAFVAGRPVSADPRNEGTFDIYVMNADGGSRMRITSGLAVGHHLAWQPVFES